MYNIKLTNYVPKPEPVTSDYLICAHYYAAWKKKCALLHEGFDDLHDYPERTPLAGYYDEGNPVYSDWEIKWAVEHGINCFIHCWYRYKENVGKPVTREGLRCAHGLHDGFFNAKYEQMINFAIMFECSPRWGSTNPDDLMENLMPYWLDTYFKRGNYLVIDNKPVLFVFQWRELLKVLGTPEEQKRSFDLCREYCRQRGFDGMIFAAEEKFYNKEVKDEILNSGYDFAFSYNWDYNDDDNSEQTLIKKHCDFFENSIGLDPKFYITTASCFWDSEPRTTDHWVKELGYAYNERKTWYFMPDAFRKALKNCKRMTDALPQENQGRNIIMIDNWNEWDEGHYIAPSHRFGFKYLQAIREELTHCDNLPDYRMPQDIGLSNFNETWDTPDLRENCIKKFGVE